MGGNSEQLKRLQRSNEERNQITRESIETALLQLLRERSIQEISIEQIVNRAGVSRMAYYRNYGSKDAILTNIINKICAAIRQVMHPYLCNDDWPGARSALFQMLYSYKDTCEILIKAHETERVQNFFNDFASDYAEDDSDKERYRMYFWAGATYNLMYEWIREGMQISPDLLAEYCNEASAPRN
ncbi:MAG: TetR/AcrR family transcriptional regulator [Oscillospiraceae bacterium]